MATPVRYITKEELEKILKSDKEPKKDYLVVDVRDDDYVGGNILNSMNYPSETFYDKVENLVKDAMGIPKVIFHCALSQQRGPKSARIYAQTREDCATKQELPGQEVLILRGGFTEWQAVHKDDPKLVENWDESIWGGKTYYSM